MCACGDLGAAAAMPHATRARGRFAMKTRLWLQRLTCTAGPSARQPLTKATARVLGVFGLILLSVAATATPASAAKSSTAPAAAAALSTATASTPPSTSSSSSTSPDLGVAAVIVCTGNVQNPHKSTHVPGTVNVVVTLTCTARVPQINIRAALYRNGLLVKDSGQKTVNNTSFASHNAAVPCVSGTYRGWMSTGVLFPPGYIPPTSAGSAFGNSVSITC